VIFKIATEILSRYVVIDAQAERLAKKALE